MNSIKQIFCAICAIALLASCNFLDVVPDNEVTLEDVFFSKENAYNGLAKMYWYLPEDYHQDNSTWLLGDDYLGRIDKNYYINTNVDRAIRVMRGEQSNSDPLLNTWSGRNGGRSLYQGIRECNIFLMYVDGIENLDPSEREDWRAQAKFLKAYYHFLLLRQYGPVIISDAIIPLNAEHDELFQRRSKVDDVFNYIIKLMDEAIPKLSEQLDGNHLGLLDRAAGYSIKARVLLFRASDFFNGNIEMYGNFLDFDGQPYFLMDNSPAVRKQRWKDAADAADEALKYCLNTGRELYRYQGAPYLYDSTAFRINRYNMQTIYDLRMVVVDPWNRELIWGNSNVGIANGSDIQFYCQMRPSEANRDGNGVTMDANVSWANQWLCASYNVASRYYTKNGLPIEECPDFNVTGMFQTIITPSIDENEYRNLYGILQPDMTTIRFHIDREPRFYANLAISAGYFRTHMAHYPVSMYSGGWGGRDPNYAVGDNEYRYFATGIGIQKMVHPESKPGSWMRVKKYPYPIIRLADVYLMKAEALNEYLDAPTDEVWDAINAVRGRAGIPTVQESWAKATQNRNWHTSKEGMRKIILRERGIELAFEGSHFWDMWRHKLAVIEFNRPIMGWSAFSGTGASSFFILEPKQARRFTTVDYLWPLDNTELNRNENLKQNPGWK